MKASIKNNVLTIEIEMDPKVSKSGKSKVIASSGGNVPSTAVYEGKVVTIGLNAYVKS